ncbi:protein kinase [Micromonospora terminaliae]|uniref:non-specific serine/threonine protein kinase n=1 Tax=Micromonospora terminaliae TaxID=1914461 RepID=A0AAJ2ZKB0_9ACTN|nr:serine/threonine-protein kinase [Micromonospora terminaliae]NES30623.1 protein kinase [Micromonospora terminaliae]QGL49563.1 protein kinase [Micromonospora terminaliae]
MGAAVRNGAQLLGERYRLVEQLGAGGMSVVWRGYDEVLGRQVAIKVLASRLASDKAFRHRIRIEAQAAARLCHPNITNVYDYGESEQVGLTVPYVVMELVDGGPLSSRLGRGGQLPWREALTIGAEVASALAAAHARGVVHRDVTPGNVMLTSTGVKVVDFGISALVGESEKGPDGALLGTPAYLAPERLDNGQVSPATDVYAVGLLLYRMLTGRLPWQASTTTQMLRAHMYNEPDPMPAVVGLPDEVAELVRRCLAKRPEDRPATAEVARTLADAAGIAAIVPVSPALGQFDPALTENAGTTILPWSSATDALPFSAIRTKTRRAAARRRKVEAGVAAAGLIAVTATLWGVTSKSPASGGVEPTEARMGLPEPIPCAVDYVLRRDSGTDFTADVTLTNTGTRELRDWTMSFTFPGQQKVGTGQPAVRQQGNDVLLRAPATDAALAPGASKKVSLTGSYTGANPLPVEFKVDGSTCGVQVSGVAGSAPTTAPPPVAPPAKPAAKVPAKAPAKAAPKTAAKPKPPKSGKGKESGKGKGR